MIKRILSNNKRFVLGIDPATGSKSACGLALYDRLENKVLRTWAIWPERYFKHTYHRIKNISEQVSTIINTELSINDTAAHIEWFIMRGKGGQTLQRVIGSIMTSCPYALEIYEVHNIGTKKNLTGRSVADKADMGAALLERLHVDNYEFIQTLIKEERWDEIDAIAIALNNNYR